VSVAADRNRHAPELGWHFQSVAEGTHTRTIQDAASRDNSFSAMPEKESSTRDLGGLVMVITTEAMPTAIDLTGRKFNRLTVLRFIGSRLSPDGHPRRMYVVRCDCGVEKELMGIVISSGGAKSCGCLKHDGSHSVTHGQTRGGWTAEYRAWQSMIRRCHTPGASTYVKYGAKGTRVCDEWRESFEAFFKYMGPKPTPKHSLDRINPYGHYEPGNVRWATPVEQANNQRRHHPPPSGATS